MSPRPCRDELDALTAGADLTPSEVELLRFGFMAAVHFVLRNQQRLCATGDVCRVRNWQNDCIDELAAYQLSEAKPRGRVH